MSRGSGWTPRPDGSCTYGAICGVRNVSVSVFHNEDEPEIVLSRRWCTVSRRSLRTPEEY